MSKPSPARYRTTNWPEYNKALRRRGSRLVWLDREMEWFAPASGRPGRPQTFLDAAIQFGLSLKVLFGLALRQTIGMVESLLKMAGLDWPVPDTSTLCRRQGTVTIQIPYRRSDGPLNLLVDSTGVKIRGGEQGPGPQCGHASPANEWQVRRHGLGRRRQWRKVHLAMDAATGDIRAVEFTSSRQGDSPVLPDLLAQIPPDQPIGTVTADGAYDTRTCHSAIVERGGTAIIPIRKIGRAWKEDGPAARARNETLRATQRFGRALRKRWTGTHARSRAEAKMLCLKSFGDRIMAKDPDRQTAEIHTRIALMNRFSAFGQAEIVRVA